MLPKLLLFLFILPSTLMAQNAKPLIATDNSTQTCNSTRMVFSPGSLSCSGSVATVTAGGSGNVGIGTIGKLAVYTGTTTTGSLGTPTLCTAGQFATGIDASGNATGCGSAGSSSQWLTVPNVGIGTTSNVGIGTIATSARLNVLGNVGIGTIIGSSYLNTAPPSGGMIAEGNVGIGTIFPTAVLHIMTLASNTYAVRVDGGQNITGTLTGYTGSTNANLHNFPIGNDGGTGNWEAQQFALSGTTTITGVVLKFLATTGSPSGTVAIRIETESAGLPSGTLANANLAINITPTASAVNTITFASSASIGAGNYWLVAKNNTGQSSNNYWSLDGITSSAYSGNFAYNLDGGGWNIFTYDEYFSITGSTTSGVNNPFVVNGVDGNVGIGTVTPRGALVVFSGNVGIGTQTPGVALDVAGNIRATGFTAGQALCAKTDKTIGQCTSVVGVGGACTCS